jgi:hypothetical protein
MKKRLPNQSEVALYLFILIFNFTTLGYFPSAFILLQMFTACAIMIATTATDINTINIIILSFRRVARLAFPAVHVCYPKSFYLSTFFSF